MLGGTTLGGFVEITAFFFPWMSVESKSAVVTNKDMNISLVQVG